jgi:hypothetical protein
MSFFKEHFIKECIAVFKRDDVHQEVNSMFKPLFQMILQEIYPYIIISMVFLFYCYECHIIKLHRDKERNEIK